MELVPMETVLSFHPLYVGKCQTDNLGQGNEDYEIPLRTRRSEKMHRLHRGCRTNGDTKTERSLRQSWEAGAAERLWSEDRSLLSHRKKGKDRV